MKLLILSFYYEPDLSAGSFRATALVNALHERLGPDAQIDVVTTQPNRYSSYSASEASRPGMPGVNVIRIPLPAHRSDMMGQSRAFIAYARATLRHVRNRRYDLVFATSSRLMTAALGAWVSRRTRTPLYLDIRDIFVDTIKDVLPGPAAPFARRAFSMLERWTMRRASVINLVSRGFAPYFHERYPRTQLRWFTNGIDDEFANIASPSPGADPSRPMVVLYAGNMGEGQGLHSILPKLAKLAGSSMHFIVIGDGGRRQALVEALEAEGVRNVELRGPVPRAKLIEEYRRADVLFLHLNDYDAFEKVLPSKIFEYGAMGKPIWAGVSGFAASFLREEVSNAAVFKPCDERDAMRAFGALTIADLPRTDFVEKFLRVNIARNMAADIVATVPRQAP